MAIVWFFLMLTAQLDTQEKSAKDWLQSNCKLNPVDNICKQSVIDNNKIAYFISKEKTSAHPSA